MNAISQSNPIKPKRKIGKTILKIFACFFSVMAGFMVIGGILHATYFKAKYEQIKPYGQLVEVADGKIHVYSMGNGEKTIVLLPGMGVALPSAEFGPLMRKLSEKYTVVCVEYFGVGFSSQTSQPRTTENYTEEIRAALGQAGFQPPYILMPHSISGVYSEYYAAKYPGEVEAIISLDGSPTSYVGEMPAFVNSALKIAKYQQAAGTTSIMAQFTVNKKDLLSKGYTEKELDDAIIFSGFSINDTFIEQTSNSAECIKQAMDSHFLPLSPISK